VQGRHKALRVRGIKSLQLPLFECFDYVFEATMPLGYTVCDGEENARVKKIFERLSKMSGSSGSILMVLKKR
jgi:hypothetical protein